ncbi:MAG: hypothetical protein ACK4TA_03850 [Saprospiraceae bacterium]
MKYIFFLMASLLLAGCAQVPRYEWVYEKNISLDGISPVGLVVTENGIWIADSDHNRIVKTDFSGQILESYDDLQRPMHLGYYENTLYFPEYSSDTIRTLKNGNMSFIGIPEEPDAPAGVEVAENLVAVADFYNGRIILQKDGNNKTFGKKGSQPGELNYPTDVQWMNNQLYVADAYNHRVQVFDENGKVLKVIGEAEKMNAATGLFVADNHLVVTDFENNRVLTYTPEGELKHLIKEHLDKPVDVYIYKDKLYVANYKGKSIAIFKL